MYLMPQSGQTSLGQLADQLADVGHDQALHDRVQRQVRRRFGQGQTCLSGTGPAKMKLALLTARRFGQMNRGLVVAPLTHHRPDHPAGSD